MYNYQKERPKLFTENGLKLLIQVRDNALDLLNEAGAFRADKVWKNCSGDSWMLLAALDYLVEKGEIVRVSHDTIGQHQIFIKGNK